MRPLSVTLTGACENTLRDVDLVLPKERLILLTGRSGSGKSSLAVDTLFAEAQREWAEGLSAHVRTYLAKTHRPRITAIEGLSPAVLIEARVPRASAASTVGTVTDLWTGVRRIFAAFGEPSLPMAAFSFNTLLGACPVCRGSGKKRALDLTRLLDLERSLADGAVRHPSWRPGGRYHGILMAAGVFDTRCPLGDLPDAARHDLLWGEARSFSRTENGVTQRFTLEGIGTLLLRRDDQARAGGVHHEEDDAFLILETCPACGGRRLTPEALSVRVEGLGITEIGALPLDALKAALHRLGEGRASDAVSDLLGRIDTLMALGLGHLSLDRPLATLSGGEVQRVKLARHLASQLSHLLFIIDEPTVGLHAREVRALITVLERLRDRANTVIVIDHHKALLRAADAVVEMGPGAGRDGGTVVAQGPLSALLARPTTLCARLFAGDYDHPLDRPVRRPVAWLQVRDAPLPASPPLSVEVPLGVLACLVGVSGSGKTSLARAIVAAHPDARLITPAALSSNARSVVATFLEVFPGICKEFAAATGQPAALFRFNGAGACPQCGGLGYERTDMHFLDAVRTECPECRGTRYGPAALRALYRERSIADVLAMTLAEAATFFRDKTVVRRLQALIPLGLGYLTLGRGLETLSAGEAQRLSLSRDLDTLAGARLLILDEPARGLHPADVAVLLEVCASLLTPRRGLLVIEHNVHFVRAADWVIELGPGAGAAGGAVIAQGTPADLAINPSSLFGPALRADDA